MKLTIVKRVFGRVVASTEIEVRGVKIDVSVSAKVDDPPSDKHPMA